jgi:hypothetical protein
MHVLAIRRPGQRGTLKLLEHYGKQLVCVRYRYDAKAGKRYKTVEVIVDESIWQPPAPHPEDPKGKLKINYLEDLADTKIAPPAPEPVLDPEPRTVGVKVFFRENGLREQVKSAGGRWSKTDKLWQLPYDTAVLLGLKHRIAKQ